MKEVTTDFIRLEITRLGAVVIETGLFHPSGVKLHSAGEVLTLAHARALHESVFTKLFLLEFGEDERTAKRSLGVEHVLPANVVAGDQLSEDIRKPGGELRGVEHVLPANVVAGDQLSEDIRKPGGELLLGAGTTIEESHLAIIRSA